MEQNIAQNSIVSDIRNLIANGSKIKDIANSYGVNRRTINRWLDGTRTPNIKNLQEKNGLNTGNVKSNIPFISGIFIGTNQNTESVNSGNYIINEDFSHDLFSYDEINKQLNCNKNSDNSHFENIKKKCNFNPPTQIYTPTPNKINSKQEELLEFLTSLAPIHYDAPKRPTVYQKSNKIALVIGDTHFGCEHQPTLDLFLKTVEALKPEKIIINGDSCDLFAISKYPKDVRHTYNLLQERESYHKFLKILHDITAPYNAEITENNSNHSGQSVQGRLWRYLSDRIGEMSCIPEVIEALSYENIFFPRADWSRMTLVDYVELVPEFIIIHGDVVRKKGGMSGIGMMEKYNTSMIINHCHRMGSSIRRLPSIGSKKEKFLRVYENACAADIDNCVYTSAADWSNGFSIVNYSDIDNIAVEQCLVQNNTVSICALGKTLKV